MEFAQTAPMVLLVAGVIAFLVSTIQMPIVQRSVAWGAGGLLLLASWLIAGSSKGPSVFALMADAAKAKEDSVLAQALERNGSMIFPNLIALLDVFMILGVIVAIVALIAFTPGDKLEKAVRPVMFALIGAVGGGVIALSIAALGVAAPPDNTRPYAANLVRENMQSADTFWINEHSLQLYGVDAPEKGQLCISGGISGIFLDCGEIARERLALLVANRLVTCVASNGAPTAVPDDLAARALVSCAIQDPAGPVDLARRMVAEGIASPFPRLEKDYAKEMRTGATNPVGVTHACMLTPDAWRNNPDYVAIFKSKDARKIRDIPARYLTPGCKGRI